MKEQVILEILHHLPSFSTEQLAEVKQAVRMALCGYELSKSGTSLQAVDEGGFSILRMYLESCEQAGLSKGTARLYRYHLSRLLSFLNKNVADIVEDDIYLYFARYRSQRAVGNSYLNQIRIILNGFFKWLVKKRMIRANPVDVMDPIKFEYKLKKPFTSREVELIRSSCRKERDLAIVECLYSSGVRASELLRLNREDISFSGDDIVVLGKGNKERVTYLNARAHIHLKNYLLSRTDDNPALFVGLSSPHNRLTIRGLEDIVRRIGVLAGVEKVHPHRFRRTSATDLLNAGMPIEQVQEFLGHKSIETTRIYCTVSREAVRHNHRRYMHF